MVSIYVPGAAPIVYVRFADEVAVLMGLAGTPHALSDALCAAFHVDPLGAVTMVIVTPGSRALDLYFATVPVNVAGAIVGVALGVGVAVTMGVDEPVEPPLPPPHPHPRARSARMPQGDVTSDLRPDDTVRIYYEHGRADGRAGHSSQHQ